MKDIEQRKVELRETAKFETHLNNRKGFYICDDGWDSDDGLQAGIRIGRSEIAKKAVKVIELMEEQLKQESVQRDMWRKKYYKSVTGEEINQLKEELEIATKAIRKISHCHLGNGTHATWKEIVESQEKFAAEILNQLKEKNEK